MPRNCKGRTANATVTAAQLTLGRGLSGPKLSDKLKKLWIGSSTLHPTKAGQKQFAGVVQTAFGTTPAPVSTVLSRLSPVTDQATLAPGFTVNQRFPTGGCVGGSEVGQAYRCFSDHFVFDPCYAVAEPGTGDGTGVVCVTSPFTNELAAIDRATGLGWLDQPARTTNPSGYSGEWRALHRGPGAHGADTAGRVIDYYCDDKTTVILRGLSKPGQLWSADIGTMNPDYSTVVSGSTPTYVSGVSCSLATLIVVEWDNGHALESGWSCEYSDEEPLLCQPSASVASANAPAFFAAAHLRAIATD